MIEEKSMEVNAQNKGLTIDFRQNVFNMFVKRVIELGKKPTDPDYNNQLRKTALNIEAGIYKKAKNRNEYLAMIQSKLDSLEIKRKAPTSENQSTSKMIQTPVVHANQSAQPINNATSSLHSLPSTSHLIQESQMMSMPAAVSTMQQRNTPIQLTGLHQLQQGRVFERQNVPQGDALQHSSMQHSRPMNESRLNIGGYQQQSPPLISSMVKPQEQGTSFHNTSVQKSHMPSSPIDVQNFDVCQSQTAPAQTPSTSFLDAGTVNAADWKPLLIEYRRARMDYLPELISMQKKVKEDCAKAQGVIQHEKTQNLKNCELMIRFLQLFESDLTCFPKERIGKNLSTITHFFNSMKNQAPKVSNEQISVNQLQNTPFVQPTALLSKNVFPQSQFNAPTSPLYCPIASKQIDMQAVLNNGSQDTAEQNAPLNLKRNSEPMLPSDMDQPPKKQQLRKPRKLPKERDFMDSMFIPSTKPTRGRPRSTKQPPLQKKNTSCVSDPRAMSQNMPSMAAVYSAPTPVTPSSVPKEIREPAQSVSPKEIGVVESAHETEVQDKSASFVTSGTITSSLPVDLVTTPVTPSSVPKEIREPAQSVSPKEIGAIEAAHDTEVQDKSASLVTSATLTTSLPSDGAADSSQPRQSAMLPIERLIRAVQTVSKDTLKSAMNDIYSAINDMDKLPEYASYDQSYRSMDYTAADEHMLYTRLRRDIDASSRDNHRPNKVPNHDLVVAEVREINQRLIETRVEITSTFDSESSKGTVVRCSYMTLSESLKKRLSIMSPLKTLSIEFLVPSKYPESPPKILDSRLHGRYDLETEAVLEKAKCEFTRRVQGLVLSIGEMAKAWDQCARQTFNDVALNFGVETFGVSWYGTWRQV